MNTILSVATIKDNTYHLMRHVWNDVQEDWPFYSEQDKQMLKRYKEGTDCFIFCENIINI